MIFRPGFLGFLDIFGPGTHIFFCQAFIQKAAGDWSHGGAHFTKKHRDLEWISSGTWPIEIDGLPGKNT